MDKLDLFEDKIGYKFKNRKILFTSLTHSSYANEKKTQKLLNNERLEFLGDSVLSLVVTGELFSYKTRLPEGKLTRIRAAIVCEDSLKSVAESLELGKYIYLGKGEEITGGRNRASILSDAVEAIIAAIYIDGGFELAKKFIIDNMGDIISSAINGKIFNDYKTQLQEVVQKTQGMQVKYSLKSEIGPDHNKIFEVSTSINGINIAIGKGKTKKDAEREAAKLTLEKING
ncbi:MAG: ribonuclease III [Filifactoraceae bacterium]